MKTFINCCLFVLYFIFFSSSSITQIDEQNEHIVLEKNRENPLQDQLLLNQYIYSDIRAIGKTNYKKLLDNVKQKERIPIIIQLDVSFMPEGLLNVPHVFSQRQAIQVKQDILLRNMLELNITAVKTFRNIIPYIAMQVDEEALLNLFDSPHVVRIVKDEPVPPSLMESVNLIGANNAWAQDYTGDGYDIVILDTGVDLEHPFFDGKIVDGACFSSTVSGMSATLCPDGSDEQIDLAGGVNCDESISGCDHGTHVAGIAAGSGTSPQGDISGVASGANIISIQVFSRFDDPTWCRDNPVPCVLSYPSDQIQALTWVFENRNDYNIASVNMSLGAGEHDSHCDDDTRKEIIDNLRSVNIATVIASGNDEYTNALNAPACISTAISVGSTTKQDQVSNFSNSATFLDLLAPGGAIYSAVPGGFGTMSGTSMAAPHIAGAWAVVREFNPNLNVDNILQRFIDTGTPILDTRNNIITPRIQLDSAVQSVSIVINNIQLNKETYNTNETALLSVLLDNSLEGANVSYRLSGGNSQRMSETGGGLYQSSFATPSVAGSYNILISAKKDGYTEATGSIELVVTNPLAGHDFAITHLSLDKNNIGLNDAVRVIARVDNVGNVQQNNVPVVLRLIDPNGNTVDSYTQYVSLSPGGHETISRRLWSGSGPEGNYIVEARSLLETDSNPSNDYKRRSIFVGDSPAFSQYREDHVAILFVGQNYSYKNYTLRVKRIWTTPDAIELTVTRGSNTWETLVYRNELEFFDNGQLVVNYRSRSGSNEAWCELFLPSSTITVNPHRLFVDAGSSSHFRWHEPSRPRLPSINSVYGEDANTVRNWLSTSNFSSGTFNVDVNVPLNAQKRTYRFWPKIGSFIQYLELVVREPHNVRAVALSPENGTQVNVGDEVEIVGVFKNEGGYDESDISIRLDINGPDDYSTTMHQSMNLARGEEKNAAFNWNTLGLVGGDYNIDMEAIVHGDPYNNNSKSSTIELIAPSFEVPFTDGWNLLGLPIEVIDAGYRNLFPKGVEGTLYAFDGSYQSRSSMEAGSGYWLRFSAGGSVKISGGFIGSLTVSLTTGWNLISGISQPIPLSEIDDPASIILPGSLFGFDGSYYSANTIDPGKGYWVRASGEGNITLTESAAQSTGEATIAHANIETELQTNWAYITVEDNAGKSRILYLVDALTEIEQMESYSLPPTPPGNAFDARFIDGYYAGPSHDAVIRIQSNSYPLVITLNDDIGEYIIESVRLGDIIETHTLRSGIPIELTREDTEYLRLLNTDRLQAELIPDRYSLSQNYPNPFNPMTTIQYALPKDSYVRLEVFNMLGQSVQVLVDEEQTAGTYEVVFDGSVVPSGVYVYRITALAPMGGDFVDVKKLVFLK